MGATGKPRLLSEDLYKALKNRTGVPASVCEKVIKAYCEIVKQGIVNRVEIPLNTVGTFSYQSIPPMEYNEWLGQIIDENGERQTVIFFQTKLDGKLIPTFRPSRGFKKSIMDNTLIPYAEEDSIEGYRNKFDKKYPRIDYAKYYLEHKKEEDAKKQPLYEPDDYDLMVGRSELHGEG